VDGVRNGAFRRLFDNGVVNLECQMRNDQLHGTLVVRDSQDRVLDRSTFIDGTGVYKIFTSNGTLGWKSHFGTAESTVS
jgi:antitoxin component YwqK of YwqJK toxin-antitoxin module